MFTVAGGTFFSQIIPLAILPILTRLYSPEEFGTLALYIAFFSILSVVVTGRYEMAIMLPKKEKDAISLFQISFLFSFIFSIFFLLVILFNSESIMSFLKINSSVAWLYFLPFSIFLAGLYQTYSYWLNRNKKFSEIAFSKIVQSSSISFGQLGMKLVSLISNGLIFGYIVGQIINLIYLSRRVFLVRPKNFFHIDLSRFKKNLILYKRFPLISSFSSLLDRAAVQMPILLISRFYDQASLGIFSILLRFLDSPFAVLNHSISLVFHKKVVDLSHEDPSALTKEILQIFFTLLLFTLPFILIVYIFGAEIFRLLLGSEWGNVGDYAFLIMIVVSYRFCVSPLSVVLGLKKTLHLGAYWQVLYFLTISLTLILSRNLDFINFIKVFVIHEVLLYSIYLVLIIYGSNYKRLN